MVLEPPSDCAPVLVSHRTEDRKDDKEAGLSKLADVREVESKNNSILHGIKGDDETDLDLDLALIKNKIGSIKETIANLNPGVENMTGAVKATLTGKIQGIKDTIQSMGVVGTAALPDSDVMEDAVASDRIQAEPGELRDDLPLVSYWPDSEAVKSEVDSDSEQTEDSIELGDSDTVTARDVEVHQELFPVPKILAGPISSLFGEQVNPTKDMTGQTIEHNQQLLETTSSPEERDTNPVDVERTTKSFFADAPLWIKAPASAPSLEALPVWVAPTLPPPHSSPPSCGEWGDTVASLPPLALLLHVGSRASCPASLVSASHLLASASCLLPSGLEPTAWVVFLGQGRDRQIKVNVHSLKIKSYLDIPEI